MSVRPANWRRIVARDRTNPINRHPPTRFPHVDEIMRDVTVQAAIQQAWRDTNADAERITAACEQGGWVYMDLRTGRISIRRKVNRLGPPPRPGENQTGYLNINLNYPPTIPGSVVVAVFHTHPTRPFTGPSGDQRSGGGDIGLGWDQLVPGIVRGQGEQFGFTGPDHRIDDFRTAVRRPGFPNPHALGTDTAKLVR